MSSLRNQLKTGIAAVALGVLVAGAIASPASAFAGLGHVGGGFSHIGGMGGFGRPAGLGQIGGGRGFGETAHGLSVGRTSGLHLNQTAHVDKAGSGAERGTTTAKEVDAKPKLTETNNTPLQQTKTVDKETSQPTQQPQPVTDNPPSASVPQTADGLPPRTTDQPEYAKSLGHDPESWTPRPGTPIAQNFVEDLQDWWNNYTPVKLSCCYVKFDDPNPSKRTLVSCARRDSPAEAAIAPACKKATCTLYINGTAQLKSEHEYNPSDTYSCGTS
ncbi:MAG TPA: hypothetical protein VEJ37_04675 [Xanthobacteraceae bacterium]|nr:hypothetical protein [Xanthobacteraceae bacterium]